MPCRSSDWSKTGLLTGVALAMAVGLFSTAAAAQTLESGSTGDRTYEAADFEGFAPQTALDMLNQVPGFGIRQATVERGLGQAKHKNVHGLTVRLTAGNILSGESYLYRTAYQGRRTDPVAFVERRDRTIGPIFGLDVRGRF